MPDPVCSIRPLSKPERADLKAIFRVYMSATVLSKCNLSSGDVCLLSAESRLPIPAIAFLAPEKLTNAVIQTSNAFQVLHNLKLGDKVSISAKSSPSPPEKAGIVEFYESTCSNSLDPSQHNDWEWCLMYSLSRAEFISPGMILEGIELRGHEHTFRIKMINGSETSTLYRVSSATRPRICLDPTSHAANAASHALITITDQIGGLTQQLSHVNENLRAYIAPIRNLEYPSFYRPRRGGILLFGPSGVGKSLILSKVAELGWASVHHIDISIQSGGMAGQAVSKVFAKAAEKQPSVIILDRLELLAGRRGESNLAALLCDEMDRLKGSFTLVMAATTSLEDLDASLRRPGRFEIEIELSIPDVRARTEILKVLSGLPRDAPAPDLELLGERTHGYAGVDLEKLLQLSVEKAKARILSSEPELPNGTFEENHEPGSGLMDTKKHWACRECQQAKDPALIPEKCSSCGHSKGQCCDLTKDSQSSPTVIRIAPILTDYLAVLNFIRPTAMSGVFLETPKVKYSDIGGNHDIKRALQEAIVWPLTEVSEMSRLGITPQKALLLYGPPGCSKTLIAQAIATESHLNFLAVKGAELLSMYVGESERAIREVFRKARAASPSVLFFDEIDAIAESRSSVAGATSGGGLNVLTTLLNELDGIEALKGVFVLAATNCPWALDVALLRPGRFDKLLYVGPPDLEARVDILKIRLARMDIDEDVDATELAGRMAGFSGAEVVSVCQRAGYQALEEQKGKGERGMKVARRHFEAGKGEVRRMITAEMETRFAAFGRKGSI